MTSPNIWVKSVLFYVEQLHQYGIIKFAVFSGPIRDISARTMLAQVTAENVEDTF